MATDQQVALARQPRLGPPAQIAKNARHVVPAFLQKLYEMVNDPKNAELIRWSEAGDSFFVLDHERFAHEVLGRWFKHRNFASFVRQLNMYGFHKIPHLQQGVLKSDNDTEFWNFAHTNFHRGQPDLLCFIQRKKQVAQPGDDVAMDMRDPTSTAPAAATLSSGQILDIHSIVNGITAIKRHQTTISAELNELKRSNQLLWQDAMAARTRHQKQQDTINRIVKFLAGVFGQRAANHKDDAVESPPLHSVIPRRQTRLMIEDAHREGKGGVVQIEDENANNMFGVSDTGTTTTSPTTGESKISVVDRLFDWLSTSGYPVVETPKSASSPTPSVMSDSISITSETPNSYFNSVYNSTNPVPPPTEDVVHTPSDSSTTAAANNSNDLQYPHQPHNLQQHPSSVSHPQPSSMHNTQAIENTPSRHLNNANNTNNNNVGYDYDPRVQTVLNHLSPIQIQQLLASLAAAQSIPDPLPDLPMMQHDPSIPQQPSSSNPANQQHHLTPYQPSPFDFIGTGSSGSMSPPTAALHPPPSIPAPPADGLISFDPYDPGMERNWQATEDIDKDVNALNSSINQLIATFGLDPNTIGSGPDDGTGLIGAQAGGDGMGDPHGVGAAGGSGGLGMDDEVGLPHLSPGEGEFDFDSFLNTLPTAPTEGMDYDMPSTAFLDEVVPSPSDGSPITHVRPLSPERSNVIGRKRKSDVSELDVGRTGSSLAASAAAPSGAGGGKPKRRKDK